MKDLMLVLSVYKGEGLQPKVGYKVVVTARLEGRVLATDPVPLSSNPEFRQEVSWDLTSTTLRKYKCARVPIRIDCHVIDSSESPRSVGYIILPLSTAVQGVTIEPKWHNLLGGSSAPRKTSPRLLLCLNVLPFSTSATGGEPMAVSEDSDCVESGDGSGSEMEVSHHSSSSQSGTSRRQNSINQAQEVKDHPFDSRISTKLKDGGIASNPQTLKKFTSPRDVEEVVILGESTSRTPMTCGKASQHSGHSNASRAVFERGTQQKQEQGNYHSNFEHSDDDNEWCDPQKRLYSVEPDLQRKSRTRLTHNHNTDHSASVSERGVPQHIPTGTNKDIPSPHYTDIRRGVSHSQSNDNSGPRRTSQKFNIQSSPGTVRENGHKSAQQNTSESNCALVIPSTSSGTIGKSKATTDTTQVIPRLNESGGFFQIGPVGEPNEGMFHFSVTIVYAKNLDQVLPKDVEVTDTDKVRFCYSLLGHIVYTDPIKDLTNPDFLAERAAGKVCSTSSNVSMYFKQHPELPIHLLLGDVCLATSSINLSSFESAEDSLTPETPLIVEGSFPLVPVMMNPLLWAPSKEPVLGIIIQLSVSLDHESSATHYPPMVKENYGGGSSLFMVDYLSSASSSDEMSDFEGENSIAWSNKDDGGGGRSTEGVHNKLTRRGHRQSDLPARWHRQRKSLMYEAAMEVETWKENQQHQFWKQWSAREAELQHHLASEWQSRISSMEAQLQQRLDQCDNLHRKITATLVNLGIKEKNVAMREEKVKILEEEIERMHREMKDREKMSHKRDKWAGKVRPQELEKLRERLEKERRKKIELQRQVRELEAANRAASDAAEAAQLGSQVKMQEVEALKRDKEQLSEQLSAALKRKQYYKLQWVRSLGQVHHLHTAHVQQAHNVRLDMDRSSPESYYVHPQPSKWLKYKEENHTLPGDGTNVRNQMERMKPRQNSETHFRMEHRGKEVNRGDSERWRKGSGPSKSSQSKQVLENVLKERQDLERLVNKSNNLLEAKEAKDYPAAIQEAERQIRSLVDR